MLGRTHMAFGLLAGLLFFSVFGHKWYSFIPLAVLGSLLPDIDSENSKINSMVPVTRWVPRIFKHRGVFHSVFPIILIYFGFRYAGLNVIGIPVAIGYASHLFSDALTKMGCNLLHPVSTMRVQGFIDTGGIAEYVVLGVVGCLSVLVIIKLFF